MKIGISVNMQFSLFSAGAGVTSLAVAELFRNNGHDVWFVNTNTNSTWWEDCNSLKEPWKSNVFSHQSLLDGNFPGDSKPFDIFFEVEKPIFQSETDRIRVAKHCIWLIRKSPILHDIEASLFPFDNAFRCMAGLSCSFLLDETTTTDDVQYIELLTHKPAYRVPFVWTPTIVSSHRIETKAQDIEWLHVTDAMGAKNPWKVHICETNNSVASSVTLPLVILKYTKKRGGFPVKQWLAHNADHVQRSDFFKNNVKANCEIEDLSGTFMGRQRVIDWIYDAKSCVLSHMRFSTIRPFLLDLIWCGIPVVHNSQWVRDISGGGYDRLFYSDNNVVDAYKALLRLEEDFNKRSGIFTIEARNIIRQTMLQKISSFSTSVSAGWLSTCEKVLHAKVSIEQLASTPSPTPAPPSTPAPTPSPPAPTKREISVVFTDMWDDFNPEYNMFLFIINEAGRSLNPPVKAVGYSFQQYHDKTPDLCIFGPFGDEWKKLANTVPKVHYTGENSEVIRAPDIKLNIGFQHADFTDQEYIRIPLWMLEIDWFGVDKERIVNPKPLSIDRCTQIYPDELARKNKFCAFVVTNPCNPVRNSAFHWLSQYKQVDSAGRLFNNVGDVIFAGRGGGGGELKKFEFLRDYKFCLAYENSSSQGYTTEKFLHAKAAGCIPIYWGDPKVERDFDTQGFIDARNFTRPEELIEAVRKIDTDSRLWLQKFSTPALDDTRRDLVRRTLAECARRLLKISLGNETGFEHLPRFIGAKSDNEAKELAKLREQDSSNLQENATSSKEVKSNTVQIVTQPLSKSTIHEFVVATFATKRFLPSLHQWLISMHVQKTQANMNIDGFVWLGQDIEDLTKKELETNFSWVQFRRLPSLDVPGFPDVWDPQHFAWKLWLYNELVNMKEIDGKLVLYLDAGAFMCRWPKDWMYIARENGICSLEDPREINERWCHDEFCKELQVTESEKQQHQIVAGILSFVAGHELPKKLFSEAWKYAQMPHVIKGPKWAGIRSDGKPFGHRHDQSILSILTSRLNVVRYPLDLVYSDQSLRRTFLDNKAFYVHRGAFTVHKPFLPGIDDCYVINLERRKDRLEKLYSNCPELDGNVQHVLAVDGKKLQMTPAIARLFRPHDFGWKKPVLGCALSHLRVWWQLANEKDDIHSYLILEDDVKFKPGWQERWKQASDKIPEDFDVIYLGGILPPNRAGFETCKVKVNEFFSKVGLNQVFGQQPPNTYFHWCNYSYVLSKQGARKVLEVLKSKDGFWTSGDHMVCNLTGILNMYFLDPLVSGCYQDDDPKYQNSAFNDFTRIDGFDSDLWNNNERFPEEETNTLAQRDAPLDIPQAIQDSLQAIRSETSEVCIGKETKKDAEQHLKQEMKDVLDPYWIKLNEYIHEQSYTDALKICIEIIKHWQDKWWNLSNESLQTMLVATGHKQLFDLPFGDLEEANKIMLILADKAPNEKREFITHLQENIRQLMNFQKLSTLPPKPQKRRILTLQLQNLDVSKLYEMTWLQELLGPQEPLRAEQVSLDSECPSDSPILLMMRPFIGEWMKILQKWKSAGSTFYVLHLSDEHLADPISFYGWEECLGVVRNYWRDELEMFGEKVVVIPLGYHWTVGKGIDDPAFRTPRLPFREYTWSFYGSDWNGRSGAMKNLTLITPHSLRWFSDFNDPQKISKEEYISNLMNSKFVPAPGGMNPETYRFYEALECGCIPLYIRQKGDELLVQKLYKDKLPLIDLPTWDHATAFMYELLQKPEYMEAYRHNILLGWKLMKETFSKQVRKTLNIE